MTQGTTSIGRDVKRSLKNFSQDAVKFKQSLTEFVDIEGVLKSIHIARHPEEQAARNTSVYHEPVDWSKYHPSSYRKVSHACNS